MRNDQRRDNPAPRSIPTPTPARWRGPGRAFAWISLSIFFASAFAQNAAPYAVEEELTVRAVAAALPAVVNISTERTVRLRDPFDTFVFDFFGTPMMRPPREVHRTVQSLGSGFLVDSSGYIMTNEHVVERAADLKIHVTLQDGRQFPGRYIMGDRRVDLALIKIDVDEPLPFLDTRVLSPGVTGQTVLVLGNPLGYGGSVSRGIISALGRSIEVDGFRFVDLIQTDAAINPGNSGGPLIDLAGHLVGVSSVKLAYTPQGMPAQGMGFAVPAERVVQKYAEFRDLAERRADRAQNAVDLAQAMFGLTLQDVTEDLAEALGVGEQNGVLVSDVEPGSPADLAGIPKGAIIYGMKGFRVRSTFQVATLLQGVTRGEVVPIAFAVPERRRRIFWRDVGQRPVTAR